MATRKVLVDFTPLRESRNFRLLFIGQMVSYTGSQFTTVAAPLQVYLLTNSSFAVGLLGLAQIVPLIVGSFVGGALADAYDRRKVLLLAQVLLASTSLGLALNAMSPTPLLWLVYALTTAQAAFSGLDHPTRSAATPTLVRRDLLSSALALNQLMWQICQVVGRGAAGVLIATVGLQVVYWLDFWSFGAAIVALLLMASMIPHGGGTRVTFSSALDGLRYLRGKQAVLGTFVIDINAMVFGMPVALFPAIGLNTFGGLDSVGLLYAAVPAGALLAAFTSGWLSSVDRQGRAVVISVIVWGAAITLFGLTSWLPVALFFLALAGAADVVSAVFRNSILQLTVPDRLRGRLSATHIAVVTGGPRLGDVESGTVAALTSPAVSVVSGGLACMVGAVAIGRLMPELARWRLSSHAVVDDDPPGAEGAGEDSADTVGEDRDHPGHGA